MPAGECKRLPVKKKRKKSQTAPYFLSWFSHPGPNSSPSDCRDKCFSLHYIVETVFNIVDIVTLRICCI